MKPSSIGPIRRLLSGACWLGFLISQPLLSCAQDIPLRNPSFEGVSRAGRPPAPWYCVSKSPDTQPGIAGVMVKPSDGRSYVGAVYSTGWEETFSQDLAGTLKAGHIYTVSFDLAYVVQYSGNTLCGGSFAIFAGNAIGQKAETLWVSHAFYNTDWKRFTAILKPKHDYTHLTFGPYLDMRCGKNYYTGALVDNFSPSIRDVPQLSVSARASCEDGSNGQATVTVHACPGPFTYEWNTGTHGDRADHLPKGTYTVKVTSPSGAEASAQVEVGAVEVQATAQVTGVSCYGMADARIDVQPGGGTAPYTFSYDGGQTFTGSASFRHAKAGSYAVRVKDAWGCAVALDRVQVEQPEPLSVVDVQHHPTSCNEVTDGKISLVIQGGIPPYQYKVNGVSWQYDSLFTNLAPGAYQYDVRDAHDCALQGHTDIDRDEHACAVLVPTAFSPNGDGRNDVFKLYMHDAVSDYRLSVYNRWGALVFNSSDPSQGWDGGLQGRPMDPGGYLWVLVYTDSKHQARKQTGSVTLVR